MSEKLMKILLLTFLIPIIKTNEIQFQDQNHLSKEQNLSDESRSKIYPDKQKIPEDASQQDEQHNWKVKNTSNLENNASEYQDLIREDLKSHQTHTTKTLDVESKSSQIGETNSSEHHGQYNNDSLQTENNQKTAQDDKNKDFVDETRPILEEENTLKLHKDKYTKLSQNETTKHHRHIKVDVRHREQTMVMDNNFPYMVVVLKGATYVCAGALIDENWVLTAATGIHLMRETTRFLRIRLGSINYKRGGTVLPIKYFEIHPYFNSSKPDYDLALIMMSEPVRFTASIRSIRLQLIPKEVTATHFIMTSWPSVLNQQTNQTLSTPIKHHRILSVTHLHPSDPEDCFEELREIGADDGVMCLESGVMDPCMRDTGAPVVTNGVLWGIISSWKPEECDEEDYTYATLVSARNISTWVHATVHGHRWHSGEIDDI